MKVPVAIVISSIVIATALSGCSSEIANSYQVCDDRANRYASAQDARATGLSDSEYGATYCPEYKMHASWDANNDGINDCADEGSCDGNTDYMSPRP